MLDQFEERNGKDFAYAAHLGMSFYKNGASFSDSQVYIDADQAPVSLREENRFNYWVQRHKNAVAAFYRLRDLLAEGRLSLGESWESALEKLEKLRDAAREAADDVKDAERVRLENDPEYAAQLKRRADVVEYEARTRAEFAERCNKAAAMEI
ncbi:hypothetical protein LzC2_42790 [Planctomycetes bacterium LzC2]|uniref:Uncharacterized protein n=1 Tax=Alienimonas chondri TaxID=2681879 RepID=A0ABX1VJ41_9PLAN|nr:hypothetical protein [Alienimonas chondri]